ERRWEKPKGMNRTPGRMLVSRQLVGQSCGLCGNRIPSDLDGRFCAGCGAAIHTRCVPDPIPNDPASCPQCGVRRPLPAVDPEVARATDAQQKLLLRVLLPFV